MAKNRKIIRIFVLIIGIICVEYTNSIANNFDTRKPVIDYCLYPNAIQFFDSLIAHLYLSYDYDKISSRASSWECCFCDTSVKSLEVYITLNGICDSCCSKQRKRLLQQVVDYYRQLDSLVVKQDSTPQREKKIASEPALDIFWKVYFSLISLRQDVEAVFRDSVPDNAELGVQLKQNIDEHTMIICQEIKEQRSILESRISGKINATHEALNCENESQTMVLDGRIAESEKRITDKLDELLKDRSEIATTSCVVIGLAYYASGVIGGLATWCPDLSSDISGTLTGEVLDYHEPATATSRIGLRLGIGGLIFKHYNISGGYIYFDDTLDPNGKRNAVHRIHISFDYWRSKDISLGIGYSALTGLGGRVLLGL